MACPFASLGGMDSNASNLIPLQLMPEQAFAGPGNDWTGTSDPKARKKIQDRIHQKARRKSSPLSFSGQCLQIGAVLSTY